MELGQRKRLERARLQYENLLNNSNWDADNGARSPNKENYEENSQNSETDDDLHYRDKKKLEVASYHYNANFDGGYKHRKGYGKAGVSQEDYPASGMAPSYLYGNNPKGNFPSAQNLSVNSELLESRFRTNTSIRNDNGNNDSESKLRTKTSDFGYGMDGQILRIAPAEPCRQTSRAVGTNGNTVKNEIEDSLPLQGASDDPIWDDRSTLIVKLQIEIERLKDKLRVVVGSAEIAVEEVFASQELVVEDYERKEKNLIKKNDVLEAENSQLKCLLNETRRQLAEERCYLSQSIRIIERFNERNIANVSNKTIPNEKARVKVKH